MASQSWCNERDPGNGPTVAPSVKNLNMEAVLSDAEVLRRLEAVQQQLHASQEVHLHVQGQTRLLAAALDSEIQRMTLRNKKTQRTLRNKKSHQNEMVTRFEDRHKDTYSNEPNEEDLSCVKTERKAEAKRLGLYEDCTTQG